MDSNKKSYRYCIVPLCKNTTISTPDKIFFNVPRTADVRRIWCQVIGRDQTEGSPLSERTSLYCCEDHFNLEADTDNYMEYRIMHHLEGKQVSLRLKKGALPHFFQCTKTKNPIDRADHEMLKNPGTQSMFTALTDLKEQIETYEEGLQQDHTNTATTSIDRIKFNYSIKIEKTTDSLGDYDNDINNMQCLRPEPLTEIDNCIINAIKIENTTDSLDDYDNDINNMQCLRPEPLTEIDHCIINAIKIKNTTDSLDDYDNDINNMQCLRPEPLTKVYNCIVRNEYLPNVRAIDQDSNLMFHNTETSEKTFDKCSKLRQAFIELDDVMPYLESCKRYCGDCKILFPTTHAIEVHSDIKHACLTDPVPILNQKENCKCSKCNRYFSSTRGLAHHTTKVHSKKFKGNRNTNVLKRVRNKTQCSTPFVSDKKFSCVHCNKSFPSQESLIDHLYSVLKFKKNTENNCLERNSTEQLCDQSGICVNGKIRQVNEIYKEINVTKVMNKKTSKSKDDYHFRCFVCSYYFKSMLGFKNHLALNHQVSFTSVERKYKSEVAFDGRCKHCPLTMRDLITYNQHMKRDHNDSYNSIVCNNLAKRSTKEDIQLNDTPKSESDESMQIVPEPKSGKSMDSVSKLLSDMCVKIAKVVLIRTTKLNNCISIQPAERKTSNVVEKKIDMNLLVPISEKRKILAMETKKLKNLKPLYFSCFVCSCYFKSTHRYMNHMKLNHQVHSNVSQHKEVKFNRKCKYCSTKTLNVIMYNQHIKIRHNRKNTMKVNINSNKTLELETEKSVRIFPEAQSDNHEQKRKRANLQGEKSMEITLVLKRILFQCTECDIHFLSAKAAMNHEHHAVEQLDSWKCETCQRVFTENDKLAHQKQHLFCNVDEFTVFKLNSLELSRVLFACPKCDIHLTEDNFMSHYPVCGLDILKSHYCKVCDIAIDIAIGKSHEKSHLNQNLKSVDFTIIRSEVMLSNIGNFKGNHTTDVNNVTSIKSPKSDKSKILHRKIKKFTEPVCEKMKNFKHLLKMFYCRTCKCYLTVANASKHNEHAVQKWICRLCGLVLPINSSAHSRLHLNFPNLKLQDFDFYELETKKHILPPIVDYYKCDVCNVNFVSRATHECSADNYLTCHVCEIKLSEEAFKLHLHFHNYFRVNLKNENLKDSTSQMLQDK